MSNYTARWGAHASVSFEANSDYMAKIRANKIAKEVNCTRTPRTITKGAVLIECIQTGINEHIRL